MKRIALIALLLFILFCLIYGGYRSYHYFSLTKERPVYPTMSHDDDTLRIAYIGDSWAFMHKAHPCQMAVMLQDTLHRPVTVESYGIGGLTSKEIYHALFEVDGFRHFMKKGYDYCYISAGINDAYRKMGWKYYVSGMDCIIKFLLQNHIHPIIQEIPDYNILKVYKNQKALKKFIRRYSMLVTGCPMDCKQQFRNTLNQLVSEKGYQSQASILHFQSWNNDYDNDLDSLYLGDGMHLNHHGYDVLDKEIVNTIVRLEKKDPNMH